LSLSANFYPLGLPYFTAASVANAGSNTANGVSPGELVTLYGFNLAQNGIATIQNGRFPTTLGNTTVNFDKSPAPLIHSGSTQVNAIVPYGIAGQSSTNITVQAGSSTYNVTVPVVPASPSLFTANASGAGQAAALNQDGTPNSPAHPANPGDVIVLFGTGEGLESPTPVDGIISQSPLPAPKLPVTVVIGGAPATVLYAGPAPGLVAGVIQINAIIPAGIDYTHHVPVTWSAGNYSSPTGVTIAVNDSPAPAFVYQPGPDNLSLSTVVLTPSRIAADSDATPVIVNGYGFTSGMVVQWNNQPRPTQFLDDTRLQVTLSGNDLESPSLGAIAVWDASQTHQITQTAPFLVYVPLLNNDLIYDSLRDKIYISVDKTQVPQGPSIAVLNPETGRIERWYSLDIEPTVLTLSNDGRYLYVALGNIVRRIDLTSWMPDLDITLGQDPGYGAREVYSMVTLPNTNTSLAVSFYKTGLSPPNLGTGVFDGAQIRPKVTSSDNGPSYLFGGPNDGTLYGGDGADFYILALDSSGVTVQQTVDGLLEGEGDSVYAGGLLYDGFGAAVDPSIPSVVMTWDNSGLIAPLLDLQKVLILGGDPPPGYSTISSEPVLSLSDGVTGRRVWSLPLPLNLASNHGPMLRWGTSGVALRESQVYGGPAPAIFLFRLNLGQ
jgi:uncharacterized protein (TIGR03437 family)